MIAGSLAARLVFPLAASLGAALVFVVQPMVGRQVLPRLGGSPEVWSVCLAFFQVALLAGYAWAWVLARVSRSTTQQVLAHATALGLAALWLPVGLGGDAVPGSGDGAGWLLGQLGIGVLAPLAAASATAPLLQAWLAASTLPGHETPYRLYAASNVGSLVALLAYPLVLEPLLDIDDQRTVWSVGYGLLAVLTLVVGLLARSGTDDSPQAAAATSASQPLRHVAVAFVSSSLLLAVTLHLASDVGSFPLLWVLPLAVWLASWALAFGAHGDAVRRWATAAAPFAALALAVVATVGLRQALVLRLGVCLGSLGVLGAALHGRLAAEAPPRAGITGFYLAIAAGGAAGGLFNALLAPMLFDTLLELPLSVVAALLLVPSRPVWVLVAAVMFLAPSLARTTDVLHQDRTFYGVLRVERVQTDAGTLHRLAHGATEHGTQLQETPEQPTTYYSREGPLGDVLATRSEPGAIAAVGLGVGTLAAQLDAAWSVDFFEVDSAVADIAQRPEWFSYLKDSRAAVSVHVADGRLALETTDSSYRLIVLDAFSSDAVPTHLLTVEAFTSYLRRLDPGGVILVHTTSWYVDLPAALSAVARRSGLTGLMRVDIDARPPARYSSWVALARSRAALGQLGSYPRWRGLPDTEGSAWTDQRSAIIPYLRLGPTAR